MYFCFFISFSYYQICDCVTFSTMPQLDLVTFVDQAIYVYIFFILQYMIISIFVLPGIYQSLMLKRLLYEAGLTDIQFGLILFSNSLLLLDTLEYKLETKLQTL